MDEKSKTSPRPSSARHATRDNFLVDAVRPQTRRVNYGDGFRFGVGLITAHLLIALIVGGLAWALVVAFKLH